MDQHYFDRNANLKFSQNSNWTKLKFSLQQIQFPVGNKIFEALSFAFLFRILSQWRDQGTFIFFLKLLFVTGACIHKNILTIIEFQS